MYTVLTAVIVASVAAALTFAVLYARLKVRESVCRGCEAANSHPCPLLKKRKSKAPITELSDRIKLPEVHP